MKLTMYGTYDTLPLAIRSLCSASSSFIAFSVHEDLPETLQDMYDQLDARFPEDAMAPHYSITGNRLTYVTYSRRNSYTFVSLTDGRYRVEWRVESHSLTSLHSVRQHNWDTDIVGEYDLRDILSDPRGTGCVAIYNAAVAGLEATASVYADYATWHSEPQLGLVYDFDRGILDVTNGVGMSRRALSIAEYVPSNRYGTNVTCVTLDDVIAKLEDYLKPCRKIAPEEDQ